MQTAYGERMQLALRPEVTANDPATHALPEATIPSRETQFVHVRRNATGRATGFDQ